MFRLKFYFSIAVFVLPGIIFGEVPLPEYPPSCPNIAAIKDEPSCNPLGLYYVVTVSENVDYTCLVVDAVNRADGDYPQHGKGIFKNGSMFELNHFLKPVKTSRGMAIQKHDGFFYEHVGYVLYVSADCSIYVEYSCEDIGRGKPEDLVMVYSRNQAPLTEFTKKILTQNGLQNIALQDNICPPNF